MGSERGRWTELCDKPKCRECGEDMSLGDTAEHLRGPVHQKIGFLEHKAGLAN
jgi:hypothetical protein